MNKLILLFTTLAALFVAGLRQQFCTANAETTVGRHAHATTKLADGAFGSRHLLVKLGSDSDHATPSGAADRPYGITDDMPGIAGTPIHVQFLTGPGTKRMISTGALAEDADVYTADGGKVQPLPVAAGTYWLVGTARGAAIQSDDTLYYVEIESCRPVKLVVAQA